MHNDGPVTATKQKSRRGNLIKLNSWQWLVDRKTLLARYLGFIVLDHPVVDTYADCHQNAYYFATLDIRECPETSPEF